MVKTRLTPPSWTSHPGKRNNAASRVCWLRPLFMPTLKAALPLALRALTAEKAFSESATNSVRA